MLANNLWVRANRIANHARMPVQKWAFVGCIYSYYKRYAAGTIPGAEDAFDEPRWARRSTDVRKHPRPPTATPGHMVHPFASGHVRRMIDPKLTVYHDGSCPLCRLEISHYRNQAGAEQIRFVDIADPDSYPGPGLSHEVAMRRFHVRLPSGKLASGASAFIEIWKVLPRWRWSARIARLPGVTGMLDVGYTVSAPLRPVLAQVVGRFSKG